MTVRARGRVAATAVAAVVLLVLPACGSRRSEADLIALARGEGGPASVIEDPSSQAQFPASAAAGDTSTGSDEAASTVAGPAVDPQGSQGDNGGGGPAAQTDATDCPQQLSPIVIGSVTHLSGVFGGNIKPGVQAVQAWAAEVNSRGGLGCHPVRYITADDGADPSTHQALVRRLVEEEDVIAFVDMGAPLSGQAAVAYLTERQIPVIGGEGGGAWFYESPMYFPQQSSGAYQIEAVYAGAAAFGLPTEKRAFGQVSCVEAAQCSTFYDLAPSLTAKYGLDLVYRGQASLTQPDFTSVCQAGQRAGAQLFAMGIDTNSARRLLRNCQTIGYRPVFMTASALATPELAADPVAQGVLVVLPSIPAARTDNPSIARFASVLAEFAPGLELDSRSMNGWTSAMLFERASHAISEPPTSASILEGLWSVHGDDLGGITQPLTFPRGKTAVPEVCYWLVRIDEGRYVDAGDGARICE